MRDARFGNGLPARIHSRLAKLLREDGSVLRLLEQAASEFCQSPIETIFFVALGTELELLRQSNPQTPQMMVCADPRHGAAVPPHSLFLSGDTCILVIPQALIDIYRVDFLMRQFSRGATAPLSSSRKLIVECDGADFHGAEVRYEEKYRERVLQNLDHEVMRFKGSELYDDPTGCAAKAIEFVKNCSFGV